MTITKQRVEEIISRIEMYGHGAGYTAEEVYDLAVLALNLSNIANLKRYELDMEGCDSCGQDCGADMTEDSDGDYVLFDDVVKLFDFDTTTQKLESPAKEATREQDDYQALREIAKQATQGEWVAFISPGKYGTYAVHTPGDNHHGDIVDWTGFDEQKNAENNARYIAAFNPVVVQALLDELEAKDKRIAELESLTVPQLPQQAVPDEMPEPDTARMFFTDAVVAIAKVQGWNACRAAMLHSAEPVSQAYKLNALSGNSPVTQDGWISCSERMPNDKQYVWCWGKSYGWTECDTFEGYYDWSRNKWWAVTDDGEEPASKVTHWMPLPEPPQEVNRG